MKTMAVAVLLSCCGIAAAQEQVTFKASDGWTISGDYLPAREGKPTMIMLHGADSNHFEWKLVEEKVSEKGFGYLALDMRGHGKSTRSAKGLRTANLFTGRDWNSATADLDGAISYLNLLGVDTSDIYLAGASIGANLSLLAGAGKGVKGLILLSPGLNYRGVQIESALPKSGKTPVLIMSAKSDQYAYASSLKLREAAASSKVNVTFVTGASGHGVHLFGTAESPDKAMFDEFFKWLDSVQPAKKETKK